MSRAFASDCLALVAYPAPYQRIRVSMAPMLAATVAPSTPELRAAQELAYIAATPPMTPRALVSQVLAEIATLATGKNMDRVSQVVQLIAYRTAIPDPKRSRCWDFVLDGHHFFVLDLGAEGTFLYDQVTGQWCTFMSQGMEPQWNFKNGTMWGNRIVGADLLYDDIWEMVPTAVLDEAWRDIAHAVTGGLATRSRTFIGCSALRLACSIGQLDNINGSQMILRYSDDQEATWSDPFIVDLIHDDFDGEVAYRSLGSFMAPGRIFELTDSGGLIRIDGCDAFLDSFDQENRDAEG